MSGFQKRVFLHVTKKMVFLRRINSFESEHEARTVLYTIVFPERWGT